MMHGPALRFGWLPPELADRERWPRSVWTGIGALAIPLWATWPALAIAASAIPPFELLAIAFTAGWLVLDRLEGGERRPPGIVPALVCALGLLGANAFFILATASIPAAQANLISYLWPVMVVGLGGLLGLFRLGSRQLLAVGLGFAGAVVVIGGDIAGGSWLGVGLALLSGVAWAAWCVFRLWQGAAARGVLAPGCGISAVLCIGLHLALERMVVPEPTALIATIGIGVAPLALANFTWDQGLRRGDGKLLAVMAYATPLVSALILITIGMAMPSIELLLGALMIVAAGMLSRR